MAAEPGRPGRAAPVLAGPAGRSGSVRYGVALSLAALTVASLTAVAFSAAAPVIRQSFGLTEFGVGAITSCVYLGAAATSIAGGRLTDRIGPSPVLAVSCLGLALGAAVAAAAPAGWVFFAGVVLAGLGYGAVNPPTNVLADPRSRRSRGLALSVKQTGIPLGGIVAGAAVPPVAAAHGWRAAMLIPVAACVALALVSSVSRTGPAGATPPDPTDQADQADGTDPAGRTYRAAGDGRPGGGTAGIARPRAAPMLSYGLLMSGLQAAVFTFLAVYLVDSRGFGVERAGAALALLLAGGLAGRPLWGWVSDRWHADRIRVLQLCALLSAAALAVLPAARSAVLPLVLVGIGACSVGWNGAYLATVAESAGAGGVGGATGRALLLVNLGAVAGPPLTGLVASGGGRWPAAWLLCGGLSLLSVAGLQLGRVCQPSGGPGRRAADRSEPFSER